MQYGYELYLQLPCKLGSDSNGRMGFQTTLPEGRLIQPSQHHSLSPTSARPDLPSPSQQPLRDIAWDLACRRGKF